MKHSVAHDLPLDAAKQMAIEAIDGYTKKFIDYNPSVTWLSEQVAEVSFKAKGVTLKGTFEVLADRIDIDMEVPLLLRMFRQKAIDVIEREILRLVQRAKEQGT